MARLRADLLSTPATNPQHMRQLVKVAVRSF